MLLRVEVMLGLAFVFYFFFCVISVMWLLCDVLRYWVLMDMYCD